MPAEERQRRTEDGLTYALADYFIYRNHDLLQEYDLIRGSITHTTKFYMIDFRSMYKVNCTRINAPRQAPTEVRILQLTPQSRSELREKLGSYFLRIPAEDLAYLV